MDSETLKRFKQWQLKLASNVKDHAEGWHGNYENENCADCHPAQIEVLSKTLNCLPDQTNLERQYNEVLK